MDRAQRLIDKYFMKPILSERPRMVGVEIELPLVNLKKQPVEEEFAKALMDMLVREEGFKLIKTTMEGWPCELAAPSGDVISFDTTFNTLEFAMYRDVSLTNLAKRFYGYLERSIEFSGERGYTLVGRGINPYLEYLDPEPLHTPMNLAKSWYLREFTEHHDGKNFYAVCASVQTHLNLEKEKFLFFYELLKEINFVEGVLFANSPSPDKKSLEKRGALSTLSQNTLCFRDWVWENSGAPNTARDMGQEPITDFARLARYLMELKLFVVGNRKGGFMPIEPVSFREYFNNPVHPEKDIVCFRSLEPVAPTMKGTLEIRSTCTQPLAQTFAPCAFYIGLLENMKEAKAAAEKFFEEQKNPITPHCLRNRIMEGRADEMGESLQKLASSLVALARDGLIRRGFGEELYLPWHKKSSQEQFLCPALCEKEKLRGGAAIEDIMKWDCRQLKDRLARYRKGV